MISRSNSATAIGDQFVSADFTGSHNVPFTQLAVNLCSSNGLKSFLNSCQFIDARKAGFPLSISWQSTTAFCLLRPAGRPPSAQGSLETRLHDILLHHASRVEERTVEGNAISIEKEAMERSFMQY
jgi:hypothetical protein